MLGAGDLLLRPKALLLKAPAFVQQGLGALLAKLETLLRSQCFLSQAPALLLQPLLR